jgi:inosose dehydratase
MQIKIGANPLCWMNADFPGSEGNITVERCLSDISLIGYQGVELEDSFKKVLGRLPDMLASRELSCIGKRHSTYILENGIEKEMKRLGNHMDMLAQLGGEVVILSECSGAVHQQKETSLTRRPVIQDEGQWRQLCEGLEQMAQSVRERGFISAYHHHMGTVVQTKADIGKLMLGTKELGLLLDTGHLVFAGEDPLAVLKEQLPRVTHVHCKSVRPSVLSKKTRDNSSFFSSVIDGVFTVPGDKESPHAKEVIDFAGIIDALIAANYSGWVVMKAEQDPNKGDPFCYAELGYETLHSLLTQGEFRTFQFSLMK